MSVLYLSAHCIADDRTPTFSSHVESRRFRRAVVELQEPQVTDSNHETREIIDTSEDINPVILLKAAKSTTGDVPPEQKTSLEKRVESLERKIGDMTASLTSLVEAFSGLKEQVSVLI